MINLHLAPKGLYQYASQSKQRRTERRKSVHVVIVPVSFLVKRRALDIVFSLFIPQKTDIQTPICNLAAMQTGKSLSSLAFLQALDWSKAELLA